MSALATARARGGLARRDVVRAAALAVLLAAVVVALFAWITSTSQHEWPAPAVVPVEIGDRHYRLAPADAGAVERFTGEHFDDGHARTRARLAAEIDAGLDAAFAPVRARLPEFADWYYSLSGEYTRLGLAAASRLNLVEGDVLAARASSMLFPDDAWSREFATLDSRLAGAVGETQRAVRAEWLTALEHRLAGSRVPAPLQDDAYQGTGAPVSARSPEAFLDGLAARERDVLAGRVGVSTAVGGSAAAGALIWRGAAARAAGRSGRVAAARGVGRGAARAGSAAGSGLVVCAPGGPAAAGCALVAGTIAWLATDWAMLRIDEALHRDDLVAALDASLDVLQAEVRADLLGAWDEALVAYRSGVDEDIAWTFRPVERR